MPGRRERRSKTSISWTLQIADPGAIVEALDLATAGGLPQAVDHTIYSVPDPYVLAHEFKHYFDGDSHERH
jgi:hypothetical protein